MIVNVLTFPRLSSSESSSCKIYCLEGVYGNSGVMPSVLIYVRGVGTVLGFLVGKRC